MELSGIFTKFKKNQKRMDLNEVCRCMSETDYDYACFYDKSRPNDLYRTMPKNSTYPSKSLWFTEILEPGRLGQNEPRGFQPRAYLNSCFDMRTWDIQFVEAKYLLHIARQSDVEDLITNYYVKSLPREIMHQKLSNDRMKVLDKEAMNWYFKQGNTNKIWEWLAFHGWKGVFVENAQRGARRLWAGWDDKTIAVWNLAAFVAPPQRFKNCGAYEYEYSFWCPPG